MFVVAKELVGVPGMPVTTKGIRQALERAANGSTALCRKRQGTKAFEYHIDVLPAEAQAFVRSRHLQALMATPTDASLTPVAPKIKSREEGKITLYRKCPALMEQKLVELTATQREIADARIALVVEVQRLGAVPGYSCAKAIREVVRQAKAGILPLI